MTANRTQLVTGMSTRQKITAGIFAVVVIFLAWQVYGLFSGGSSAPPRSATPATGPNMMTPQQPIAPRPAPVPKPETLTPREAELLRLQQETEAKYLSAVNELQMLRVTRDIAETYKAIMTAKLDTITAEKSIVDLLKPEPTPTPAAYAQGLVSPTPAENVSQIPPPPMSTPNVNYAVISVSLLQQKWSAVIGYQGRLFNVMVGDILPPDQSRVVMIDRTGIMLEKNGIRRKISLVPII